MKKEPVMTDEKGVIESYNENLRSWIIKTEGGFQGACEASKFKGGKPAAGQRVTIRRKGMNITEAWLGEVAPAASGQKPAVGKSDKNKPQGKVPTTQQAQSRSDSSASSQPNYRFLNPYNFVRFLPLGTTVEANPNTELLGRCAPPPHDRYLGLSGRITCILTTVTPLFISDSEGVTGSNHQTYQFFQAEGKHAIPATSLRGLLRGLFETATNSCLSVFEGQRLSQHFPATRAPELIPARVVKREIKTAKGETETTWHLQLLTGTAIYNEKGTPQDVLPAAWLHQFWPLEPSKTLDKPLADFNPPLSGRLRERVIAFRGRTKKGSEIKLKDLTHGVKCAALLVKTQHPHPRISFWDVLEVEELANVANLRSEKARLERARQPQGQAKEYRVETGWLCLNNQNVEAKHSERFFFRDENKKQYPIEIMLEDHVHRDYEALITEYQKRHRKEIVKRKAGGIGCGEPILTGKDKEAGFSRFICNPDERQLRGGELVYIKLTGEPSNPCVEFMAPVSVPRYFYENSIADRLPEYLAACISYDELCPACRLFGWVHKKPKEESRVAYAGRVRFSLGALKEDAKLLPDAEIPLAILSSPKPTTSSFYLLAEDRPSFSVHYDSNHARLRGRKIYRHHGRANPREYRRTGENNNQNRTLKGALDAGNEFTFTLDFENLASVELGALFWALELEKGWHHRLGLAKPLGFGSVTIEASKLELLDVKARYATLDDAGWRPATQHKETLKKEFKEAMTTLHGKNFTALPNIQDLTALLSDPPADPHNSQQLIPVHYPRPPFERPQGHTAAWDKTAPNPEGKQYEWFMGNAKEQKPLPLACNDTEGFRLLDKKGNPY